MKPPTIWFRLLLALTLCLVVLLGTGWWMGSRAPETQSIEGTMRVPHSPADTWARLADVEKAPRASLAAQTVEVLDPIDGRPSWREYLSASTQTWTSPTFDEPKSMVNVGRDSAHPQSSRWEFELVERDGGTQLTMRIATTIEDGSWHTPFFRLLLSMGSAQVSAESYLKNTFPDVDVATIDWKHEGVSAD